LSHPGGKLAKEKCGEEGDFGGCYFGDNMEYGVKAISLDGVQVG
jgi:hypothetical protein